MSQTPNNNSENINNLISEMKKGNCVAFIGAGVSAPAVRTWPEVLDKLKTHEDLEEIKDPLTELLKSSDDRETLLFDREAAAEMIQSKLVQSKLDNKEFRKALKDALERKDPEGSKKVKDRYKLIREMPFHSLITTNFDNHLPGKTLDEADFGQLLREPFRGWIDSLEYPRENPRALENFVIKLHGDIEQDSAQVPLVFSRTGYRELLFETPNYQSLIRTILATKVVVFLGFSFSDPYLNLIRSEVLSMLKSNDSDFRSPLAYAIMNDISPDQVKYLEKHEGIAAISYCKTNDHQEFDDLLKTIHKETNPDEVLSDVLGDKKILWFDLNPKNNLTGRNKLRKLWNRRGQKLEDYLVEEKVLKDAIKKLETDKSINLLITHWGHEKGEVENGEKQSNAITLARHIRKKDIEVPIIVFAGKKHATENRDRALKFGAFDYVYEWHDLFSRIEDLFKDPVKDH